jgi:cytochrome c553
MAANYEAIMRDLNIVTAQQRCCFMLGVSAAEKAVEASQQRPTPAVTPCERCHEPAEIHFCKPCFDHLYGVTDVEWCA